MTPQLTKQRAIPPPIEDGPTRNEVFTALSNERRRYVIHYLNSNEPNARVRDIAEQLAAWENDIPIAEVTYKQRKRVYTALYQSHLLKLAKSGFIDYDRNRGIVSLAEESHQLEVYLEIVSEDEILWSEYYVGLAVVCGLLVFAAWTGTVPFASVSGYAYAAAFSVLFGASGLAHWAATKRNRLG